MYGGGKGACAWRPENSPESSLTFYISPPDTGSLTESEAWLGVSQHLYPFPRGSRSTLVAGELTSGHTRSFFFQQALIMLLGLVGNSLCRTSWPQIHRDPPACTSKVLKLEAWTHMPSHTWCFMWVLEIWTQVMIAQPIFLYGKPFPPTLLSFLS